MDDITQYVIWMSMYTYSQHSSQLNPEQLTQVRQHMHCVTKQKLQDFLNIRLECWCDGC